MLRGRLLTPAFLLLAWCVVLPGAATGQTTLTLEERETDRAILFVHGLIGDPERSFKDEASPKSWARIIVEDQVPLTAGGSLSDFAVYSVDYRPAFKTNGSLEGVLNTVSQHIMDSDLWIRHRYVYVIAHSMGGLVTKRLLVNLQNSQRALLFERIVGVALLGVPAEGSELAKFATDASIAALASYWGWNERLVRDLQTGNTFLEALANDWDNLRNARTGMPFPRVSCAFEGKPDDFGSGISSNIMANIRTVVPRLYSERSCNGAPTQIMATHIALPKPKGPTDHVHTWMRARVNESLDDELSRRHLLIQGPPKSFSAEIDFFNRQHAKRDRTTRLPSLFEEVQVDDADTRILKRFQPQGYPYSSNTLSRLLEDVQKRNRCMRLEFNGNRSLIRLKFADDNIKACGAVLVCADVDCS